MNELARQLEEGDIRDRRDNILLFGAAEGRQGQGREDSEEVALRIVNQVLPTPMQPRDIVGAHRVGRADPNKTRPILVRFAKTSTKIATLQKRKELRERGYGVSQDLTPKQRDQIRQANDQGLFAYFKGGVLHTEVRHTPTDSSRPRRTMTRSYARVVGDSSAPT